MKKKIIDETGKVFSNLAEALRYYNLPRSSGWMYYALNNNGVTRPYGHTFSYVDEGVVENGGASADTYQDPLMAKLRERYSEKELEQIAKGEGIAKKHIPFPEIHLDGEHHRMVVISDTHIGSIYSPDEWHETVARYVNDPANGVDCVLHCGDLVDGLKIGRAGTQIYELSELGYDAQRAKAVELMSLFKKPIYAISGNHDMYFKEFAGANIVKSVSEEVPNMYYIGHDTADIYVSGCTIRLFHGGDGSSYAVSYRIQKLIEAMNGEVPNILLAGHVHKFCYIYDSGKNVHGISAPCLQAQTSFMRGKKLAAHTGFLALDFDTRDGNVCNLSVKLFPFYE